MKLINKSWLIAGGALALASGLSACGGSSGGSNNSGGGDVVGTPKLVIKAPSQYPVGDNLNIPILVKNTSKDPAKNIKYTIPAASNTTGATITITSDSAALCSSIAPGDTCPLVAHIATSGSSAQPGSFSVEATAPAANNRPLS